MVDLNLLFDLEQANRKITVSSPLGANALVFWRMSAREGLSRLYCYEVDVLSKNDSIDFGELLGQSVTVTQLRDDGSARYFSGYISTVAYQGPFYSYYQYRLTLHPWIWFLSRTSDCRIFQNQSVPDIIKQVFNEVGFSDYELVLSTSYRNWEYCVQYRETTLDFVKRLLEHEGIYFYFRQEEKKSILVITDRSVLEDVGPIPYFPPENTQQREEEHISTWNAHQQVRSGKLVTKDYNFTSPQAQMETNAENSLTGSHEMFEYPGHFTENAEGQHYATVRLEELQVSYDTTRGSGNSGKLAAGIQFTLTGLQRNDQNREYLVTDFSCQLCSDTYISVSNESDNEESKPYQCQFRAIAASSQYRPARVTPKPMVYGPQTAMVVGPAGEEIFTDAHGRVKVSFHWDRKSSNDDTSSCWIRVSQSLAGKQWGSLFLPRIGQEVVVAFLEGDPDRPLITGSVYNGDDQPPYTLPGKKTQSGFKSRSSKNGDANTFNELRFEDLKGSEEVYFHAEKDFNRVVENNDTLKVGLDKKNPGDQTVEIHNNRTTTLNTGSDTLTVKQGDQSVNVDSGKITQQAMQSIEMKVPSSNYKMDKTSISQQAAQSIKLKVGASSITIEPAKITIESPEIEIKAAVKLSASGTITELKGEASMKVTGAITEVNGDGMLVLKGGMITIN